jgi:aryl-alcohol dehydrogenase-like predicted oxidoreductase
MQVTKTGIRRFGNYTIIGILLAFLLLSQNLSISAQKKPPVLETDRESLSAFNRQAISGLIRDYENNVVKPDTESQEIARQLRNRLIAIGVDQTDAYFFKYLKNERQRREWLQFLLDFLEIGTATAISITNGERAKTVISEGLGALQASRTSLNRNFKLLERQIIINQMVADRGEILTVILAKRNSGVVNYSWEDARADLRTYFNAGTLDSAIARLSATTGKAADLAEAKVRRFKNEPIIGPPNPAQITSSRNAEDLKLAIEAALDSNSNTKKEAALKSLKNIVKKLEENEEIRNRMITAGISPAPDDPQKIHDELVAIATLLTQINRRDLVKKIDDAYIEFGKLEQ